MQSSQYQACREQLLQHIDELRSIRDHLVSSDPLFVNSLPVEARHKMLYLDREATRLRNPDLTVAFVGGFSAGKSSLVNAFLGRYLLPESAKVTTAVPTFVRATEADEVAELHYLNEAEVDALGELYRRELAELLGDPRLAKLPFAEILERAKPLSQEGRGRRLVDQFERFHEHRRRRQFDARGKVVNCSIIEAQDKIRDETEAMFLDRISLHVRAEDLPADVVLVDLPGVSVPNPRHREVTFRFVREEAHAVVFVVMATRLFDKDEVEIMELFRKGESHIADKTFWVLNRWDSLSPQQQRQTLADFESKMQEFSIPAGYQAFRTNALHGLLSQLALRRETSTDLSLQGHIKEYEDTLASRYGNSHETAFRESQLPLLQQTVLGFLNDQLRRTTLRSAFDNSRTNFCDPVAHHLRRAKDADDELIGNELARQEKEASHQRVEHRFRERVEDVKRALKGLRNEVAMKTCEAELRQQNKQLVDELQRKIQDGVETDAYHIYQEIIADRELRKYPFHFEIEMRIVDNLNTMLKQNFRRIVRDQVDAVFGQLATKVQDALENVREDVGYSAQIMAPFDSIIREERHSFTERIDGVVMTMASQLDELLLYKPKSFFGFLGGNEILVGLEDAAKLGFENLRNPGQAIQPQDFAGKTQKIRQTLTDHYIGKVREYHERITSDISPIIINNMQEIERRIVDVMGSKYRPALEIVFSEQLCREFGEKRKELETRSRRFRDLVEQIEKHREDMRILVASTKDLLAA